MRILYITTIGGTMFFFQKLIRELIESGNVVDIATSEAGGAEPVPSCYREWGCKVYPLACSRSPLDRGNITAIQQIRDIVRRGDYDIVHCHTPIVAACTRVACKGLRKSGVKVFYTAHGFHFYTGAPLKNWLLFYPIEWLCAHWTDVLITINKEDYIRAKKHMHAKRVEYVPGVGIDVRRFSETHIDRTAKRKELGIPDHAFLLLSVGELNRNKNHQVVMKAIAGKEHENIYYMIAGDGELRTYLSKLAKELKIDDRFYLLGYRNDVDELYKVADAFVLPSLREGLNVSVMEAMASGLPCIVSKIRGNVDLVDEQGGILCAPTGAEEFQSAILILARELESKEYNFSRHNAEKAERFSEDFIVAYMKEIYKEVQVLPREFHDE